MQALTPRVGRDPSVSHKGCRVGRKGEEGRMGLATEPGRIKLRTKEELFRLTLLSLCQTLWLAPTRNAGNISQPTNPTGRSWEMLAPALQTSTALTGPPRDV